MNAPEAIAPPAHATAVCCLPIDEIVASPSNPRKHFDDAYLTDLAESIASHGVIQPITVRPLPLEALLDFNKRRKPGDGSNPQYEIVVGECRWRAAKRAGLTEIPGFWREMDDKQVLETQIIENLSRRDVHPIEEAEGYQALMARHGYTADQLAAKVGKSRSYIYGRLKFTALCAAAREAFFAGTLEASTALLIARIPGEGLQKRAVKEVTESYNGEPLSFRAAKDHIHRRFTLSLAQATFRPDDAALLPAAGACSTCPKRSGNFLELFTDITATDVCTDPDCFEAKRLARREQLIANAEAKKIPVLTGDEARKVFYDHAVLSLDTPVDDDAEGRTYRQILGDKAPVTMVIEEPYGQKQLLECADETALAKALKKAGWVRAEPAPDTAPRKGETPGANRARLLAEAEHQAKQLRRDERRQQATDENIRRELALAACWPALHAMTLDTDKDTETLLYLMAEAWFRNLMDMNELADLEEGFRAHLDATYALPDEFEDADEIPRAIALLRKAPLGRVMALLLADLVGSTECHVNEWNLDDDKHAQAAPHITAQLARLLGVPFQSLTHPAATPAEAAPAEAKGKKPAAKKGKAKADPAPALPANEAAAPPNTSAELPAWPFPVKKEFA